MAESKTYLWTSDKAGFFINKKYDSFACWTCAELCEAFTFLMENIYVKFDGMFYQQIVGIPMSTNCAPLIADLILYFYERDFMSNLQKLKRFDLIDKFKNTSRYLDDISTIDYPEFAEHIPDIYPRKLLLNKETSFSDLNINVNVIGNNFHTSFNDKRDDFVFPIIEWWRSWTPIIRYLHFAVKSFARCCTSFLISIPIIFKSLPNWHMATDIPTFGKRLESPLGHTLKFCPNLVQYRLENMHLKESPTRSSMVI